MAEVRSPRAAMETPFEALGRLAPLVREQIAESEARRSLSPGVAQAMVDAGLLRLLTPSSLGGMEIDPVGLYKVIEAAARIDGSFGWCLMILGATPPLGRGMPEHEARLLLGDPATVVAGCAFPFGRASVVEGGYRVSGRWPFASGCQHATHLMGFCIVHDGDAPRMGPAGPDVRLMTAPAADVAIVENWEVVGLQGTGSHDIVFDDVFVPEGRAIPLRAGKQNRYYEGALYRVPFLALFAWPVAAVALGIAQHSIDSALELAQQKVPAGMVPGTLNARTVFQLQLADAVAAVRSARAWLHESLDELMALAEAGDMIGLEPRINAQLAASNATRSARAAVELMYLAGGGSSVRLNNELQRCMRDMHAVSQHVVTGPATWEQAGVVLAGLPPINPMITL